MTGYEVMYRDIEMLGYLETGDLSVISVVNCHESLMISSDCEKDC